MASVSQNENEPNESITKKAAVVGAHVSAAGVVATSLFVIVDKATQNPVVVAALMGGVALIPGVGQGVILVSAAAAVGYFAIKMVYAQLAKYKTAIRLIDEFTILLHKIQKIANLTIFISTTYNFDINIDEVIEQLKIIFSRFDEVLKQDAGNYHKIEESVMNLTSAPNMEEAALDALTKKSPELEPEKPSGGGRKTQQTGGISFLDKLTFKVDVWTKQIDKDIIKLNIYLTATMSEFSIILNVIQMNLIVDGLGPDGTKKSEAIKSLMTKNGLIQRSTEYAQTRIGILVHEILKLRADFMYCKSKELDVKSKLYKLDKFFTTPDVICDEHMDKTMDLPFTKYRTQLHRYIDQIIIRLQNGDYSPEMKKSVCENVLKPYVDMLAKCKFSVEPTPAPAPASSSAAREVIVAYKLESMSPDEKSEIDRELETLLTKLNTDVAKILPQSGGGGAISIANSFKGITNSFKRAQPSTPAEQTAAAHAADAAATAARKSYVDKIKGEPYLLTTDTQISEFLNKVYEFTRRVGKTDPAVIKKAAEVAAAKLIDAPAPAQAPAQAQASAPAPAQAQGGSIPRRRVTRKKVRRMITNKSKTYKVLL